MLKGQKRPRNIRKSCHYCREFFMAADPKATICEECRKPRPCLCGCDQMASSARHPYRPGHADTEAVRLGHKIQGRKIRGKGNPMGKKEHRESVSKGVKNHWDNMTKAEKRERLLTHFFANNGLANPRRGDGFLSDNEATTASCLNSLGYSKCECPKPFECDSGWHYEPECWFDEVHRFYPDFVCQGIIIEVVFKSYAMRPEAVVQRLKKMMGMGLRVVVVTSKQFLRDIHKGAGCPTISLKNPKQLENLLRSSQWE